MNLTFRTATGEFVKSGNRLYGVEAMKESISEFEVSKLVCKPLLSVGEYTNVGGVAVMYCDEKSISPARAPMFRMDPEGDQQFIMPRLHSCVQRN